MHNVVWEIAVSVERSNHEEEDDCVSDDADNPGRM